MHPNLVPYQLFEAADHSSCRWSGRPMASVTQALGLETLAPIRRWRECGARGARSRGRDCRAVTTAPAALDRATECRRRAVRMRSVKRRWPIFPRRRHRVAPGGNGRVICVPKLMNTKNDSRILLECLRPRADTRSSGRVTSSACVVP
jgi:hypothetical protein